MATLEVVNPKDFAALLDEIETFQASSKESWYRGCRNGKHSLRPSLYRHAGKTSIDDLAALEEEVSTRFVQRSVPFLQRPLASDWDRLFLMQHYGVPTRLLDWTENPFVAMYFALNSGAESKAVDAAVWMCDPIKWNQAALSHLSFAGGILDETSQPIRSYAPGSAFNQMPMTPVMTYGTYNSPRIVAQRGGFSLFGQGTDPMEEVYAGAGFPDGIMKKIVISHDTVDEIKKSLFRKGFTESVVFPDLDGLAKEIRRVFGF